MNHAADKTTELVREQGYTLDNNGCIIELGKFEGESSEVLYFYDAHMNGDTGVDTDDAPNEDGKGWSAYELTKEEQEAFDTDGTHAVLSFTSDGFVSLAYHHGVVV